MVLPPNSGRPSKSLSESLAPRKIKTETLTRGPLKIVTEAPCQCRDKIKIMIQNSWSSFSPKHIFVIERFCLTSSKSVPRTRVYRNSHLNWTDVQQLCPSKTCFEGTMPSWQKVAREGKHCDWEICAKNSGDMELGKKSSETFFWNVRSVSRSIYQLRFFSQNYSQKKKGFYSIFFWHNLLLFLFMA